MNECIEKSEQQKKGQKRKKRKIFLTKKVRKRNIFKTFSLFFFKAHIQSDLRK